MREATLAATLTALVPATVDGLIREAIVVDGGSTDRTLAIADAAGAELVRAGGGRGYQLPRAPPRRASPGCCFCTPIRCRTRAGNARQRR